MLIDVIALCYSTQHIDVIENEMADIVLHVLRMKMNVSKIKECISWANRSCITLYVFFLTFLASNTQSYYFQIL